MAPLSTYSETSEIRIHAEWDANTRHSRTADECAATRHALIWMPHSNPARGSDNPSFDCIFSLDGCSDEDDACLLRHGEWLVRRPESEEAAATEMWKKLRDRGRALRALKSFPSNGGKLSLI